MIDDVRDALGAGLRCLFTGAVWRALLLAPLSLGVLARLICALVVLVIGGLLSALLPELLHTIVATLLGLAIGVWLTPLAMRRGSEIIARHPTAPLPPQPLPSPAIYRTWWLPLLLCTTLMPAAARALDWDHRTLVLLAILAAQVAVAPGAIVRSVLAPSFPISEIDGALNARKGLWAIVATVYLVGFGLLQSLASAIGLGVGGGLLGATVAWSDGRLVEFLLVRAAALLALSVAVAIFCTATLAHLAATLVLRRRGPGAATLAPPARAATATVRTRPAAAPRRGSSRIASALVVVALVPGIAFFARTQAVYWVLGGDFRTTADLEGDCSDPTTRQRVRTTLACLGQAGRLRVLGWGGVVGDGGPDDAALGCAAFHGRRAAVEALLASGDDVNRPGKAIDGVVGAARQTPLQQAVRTPAGLETADFLLAHGASRQPAASDAADAVQTAAAANCLPCLAWLHQRGFAMTGVSPATPLALWFDNRAQWDTGSDDSVLSHLVALGLSPSAVGTDGRSALHAAAAAANGAAVHLLLADGADPALADRDGMTPVFYAAAPLTQVNPSDTALDHDRRTRRIAVVVDLIASTPTLDGQGKPADPRHPVIVSDPYIERAYEFGTSAALDPAIRAAADQAGKPIRYSDASFVAKLPAEEARGLLARMDDAQLATVMPPSNYLTDFAGKAGWWPELARAMKGWPQPDADLRKHVWPACKLLGFAAAGAGDASPAAAQSWAVVDAWLDAGMKPMDCDSTTRSQVQDDVARRSKPQQADWQARTGGPVAGR